MSKCFQLLKKELASKPLVQSHCLNNEFTATTDASKNVIGRILSQEWHPVIFVSRMLSAAESRYSNVETEALAIVYVIGRLRQFLLTQNFKLITDHKPLEVIFFPSKDIPETASGVF